MATSFSSHSTHPKRSEILDNYDRYARIFLTLQQSSNIMPNSRPYCQRCLIGNKKKESKEIVNRDSESMLLQAGFRCTVFSLYPSQLGWISISGQGCRWPLMSSRRSFCFVSLPWDGLGVYPICFGMLPPKTLFSVGGTEEGGWVGK